MSVPSLLATPHAWDLVAGGYADVSFDQLAAYSADALALAKVESGESILDVAAGPGVLALQAAGSAREVHALDFSRSMLDQLRARMTSARISNLQLHEGDGQALPYADSSFDAAFSMFGLIFFPDRARGFAELYRVLRPGGRAVVSSWQPLTRVPLLLDVSEALAAELAQAPVGDGKGPLSEPDELAREMSAAGFEVRVEERSHALEAESIDALWAGLRRTLARVVLLENQLGAAAFEPVAAGIRRRLRERYPGPQRVEMPAWLALGKKG
jgi:SAM-dependent methyltransferase